jgi:hypothetical protein
VSDIGGIFTTSDIIFAIFAACAPGLFFGALVGAYKFRQRRILGALIGGAAGFMIFLAGWLIYLTAIR